MSKNKNIQVENFTAPAQPNVQTAPKQKYALPLESLQAHYNDAYMRERERFNSMFGVLPNNPPFENPEYYDKAQASCPETDIQTEPQVPESKFKKVKGALTAFIIASVLFLGTAVYFAISYLNS